jgi:hypothetical protein
MEIFKDIINYEGLYQVSNYGNIKSLHYRGGKREIILKPHKDIYGYFTVDLCINYKIKKCKIHRLVALAFIINSENKPQINHIDGNKENNYYKNLEWCTGSYNQKHAFKTGLNKPKSGEFHYRHKLTKENIIKIRETYKKKNITQKELSIYYNVSIQCISAITTKRNWEII